MKDMMILAKYIQQNERTYWTPSILDAKFFCVDKIVESIVFFFLDTAECVNYTIFRFNFKI